MAKKALSPEGARCAEGLLDAALEEVLDDPRFELIAEDGDWGELNALANDLGIDLVDRARRAAKSEFEINRLLAVLTEIGAISPAANTEQGGANA